MCTHWRLVVKTTQTLATGLVAVVLALAGVAFGYWIHPSTASMQPESTGAATSTAAPSADRKPIYYQDPDGKADYSPTPKKTGGGREYVPVYDSASTANPPSTNSPI